MEITKDGFKLTKVANCDVYTGNALPTAWGRLFGGQTLGQSLAAAADTVPDQFPIHSFHAYFILAGDASKEILFEVDRIRDGGSFMTRSCKAMQDSKAIFLAQMSFHKQEPCPEYQFSLKSFLPSGTIIPEIKDAKLDDLDTKYDRNSFIQNVIRFSLQKGEGWELFAMKLDDSLHISGMGWKEQCSYLGFMSDMGMLNVIRDLLKRPVETWGMNVSLDHSIHFHRATEVDMFKWSYFFIQCTNTFEGRGMATIHIFNDQQVLLATVSQEVLLREKKSKL